MTSRFGLFLCARASLLLALAAPAFGQIWPGASPVALAATPQQARPTITITSPANGAVIHSTTVTVTVSVKNFTLVPPVLTNPPVLKVNHGHLLWILDNNSNFVRSRDLTASLTHTWTNVSPGQHTVFAYLATSQHLPYPGTTPARVTVTVSPMPGVTSPVVSGGAFPGAVSERVLERRSASLGGMPEAAPTGSLSMTTAQAMGFLAALLAFALGLGLCVCSHWVQRRA